MRALIPYDYGLDLLGELPEGVSVGVWDTDSEPPEGAADATFWVPPWETLDSYSDAIAKLPSLQVLQSMSAGYDHVLPQVPPDVTFCNARGVHDVSVAEWILAVILAMVRDLPEFVRRQAERRVEHTESDSLAGKTVLILGYGSIGQAVEQRLVPFEVDDPARGQPGPRGSARPVGAPSAVASGGHRDLPRASQRRHRGPDRLRLSRGAAGRRAGGERVAWRAGGPGRAARRAALGAAARRA